MSDPLLDPRAVRAERFMGMVCLLHAMAIVLFHLTTGSAAQLLSLANVSLIACGLALACRWPLLACTVLVASLVPGMAWLFDATHHGLAGHSPTGLTHDLRDASLGGWLFMSHHGYVAPLIMAAVLHNKWWHRAAPLMAVVAWAYLLMLTRLLTVPADAVNFAWGVFGDIDHALLNAINVMPPSAYLLTLCVLTGLAVHLPAGMFLYATCGPRRWERLDLDFASELPRSHPARRATARA